MRNFILNTLLHLRMRFIGRYLWAPLMVKSKCPGQTQNELLMDIVASRVNTKFGREHHFAAIKSYADFKHNVAVQSYEDLRPYIEDAEKGIANSINLSAPLMYAQTSGTTGKPKYIPILKETIAQYKNSQHIFAYALFRAIPTVYQGKTLAIVSPAIEGKLDTGTPYGAMSGLIYKSMPRFVRAKYVVPPNVFELTDYEQKYFLIAAFALATKNITLIATANPSTLLKLEEVIRRKWGELINEINRGNQYGLKANPARAAELTALSHEESAAYFAEFWPKLTAVTTWTGGNCAALIPYVKKLLPLQTQIIEMGYLSSEFRGSITLDVKNNKSMLTLHENFFEFVELNSMDENELIFLTIENLEKGKQYHVYVTTQNGLFRYFINDLVEVDGWVNQTPTIRFVQKGKGVTNITGEKLYESHVINAMQTLTREQNIAVDFFMMIAEPDELQYSFFIESPVIQGFCDWLERYLGNLNIEFEAKRKSDRLKKTNIVFLKAGTSELYKQHCLAKGQREGQFKLLQLQYKKECSFNFSEHVREENENH